MNIKTFNQAKQIKKEIADIESENRELQYRIEILWTASKCEIVAIPYIEPFDPQGGWDFSSPPKPLVFDIDQYLVANYLKELIVKNNNKISALQEGFNNL